MCVTQFEENVGNKTYLSKLNPKASFSVKLFLAYEVLNVVGFDVTRSREENSFVNF